MFQNGCPKQSQGYCFPRVSGDVPLPDFPHEFLSLFSPRERGCSRQVADYLAAHVVFPA